MGQLILVVLGFNESVADIELSYAHGGVLVRWVFWLNITLT